MINLQQCWLFIFIWMKPINNFATVSSIAPFLLFLFCSPSPQILLIMVILIASELLGQNNTLFNLLGLTATRYFVNITVSELVNLQGAKVSPKLNYTDILN